MTTRSRVDIRDKRSEIAGVGEAFNSMADSLKERARELSDAKENAEEAKEKAEQAAARITTIFESMIDYVVIVDPGWNITYLNEKAKARLLENATSSEQTSVRPFRIAITPEIGVRFHEAISEQRSASFETFYRDVWSTSMHSHPAKASLSCSEISPNRSVPSRSATWSGATS